MKHLKVLLMFVVTLFVFSCANKEGDIEESYLLELEKEYNEEVPIETEVESSFVYDDGLNTGQTDPSVSTQGSTTSVGRPSTTRTPNTSTTTVSGSTATKIAPSKPAPAKRTYTKPKTFTSKWVDTQDTQVIKDVRLMIANREYRKAKNYLDRLDYSNLGQTDVGHLYQFEGIINYFLVPVDASAFSESVDSFQKAYDMTNIEKFKPLSILWLGMLYERYSNNDVELLQAINLFDEIINNYSNTRFANDAVFYKALVLQKLGRIEEANILINALETTTYPDALVYSKWNNDYVALNKVLPKVKTSTLVSYN